MRENLSVDELLENRHLELSSANHGSPPHSNEDLSKPITGEYNNSVVIVVLTIVIARDVQSCTYSDVRHYLWNALASHRCNSLRCTVRTSRQKW